MAKRSWIWLALISLCFAAPLWAQAVSAPAVPAAENQPRKLEDIRKLIKITGGEEIGQDMMNQMIQSFKAGLPDVPESFWGEFMSQADRNELMELNVPIYDKYLTHDEIKAIMTFYESPVGVKLISVLPQIMQESYASGEEWGRKVSEKAIAQLKEKGYLDAQGRPVKPAAAAPASEPAAPAAKPAAPASPAGGPAAQ